MNNLIKNTIPEILNSDYNEYAKYVLYNRALPYLSDGLKPTQRKILFTSLKRAKAKLINVSALSGYIKAESAYHHGDSSLDAQIVNMAQDFKCAIPYFERGGQFGTVYAPENAATRYLETMISKSALLVFKDNELVEKQWEDGAEKEPKSYLPILPMSLINAINGIGVGFAFSSTNRSPIDVINTALDVLRNKKLDYSSPIPPHIGGLVGEWIWKSNEKQWWHSGNIEIKNTTTVHVTGLAYGQTYESYETHLANLAEHNKIVDFDNLSNKGTILYEIKFTRSQLSDAQSKPEGLEKLLKISSKLDKDNFTLIDVDGKPRKFNSDKELLERFVNWRLSIYTQRKEYMVKELTNKLNYYKEIVRFIELVNSRKIKVESFKSKSDLIDILTKNHKFEYSDKLSEIKIYKLTKEEQQKYLDTYTEIENEYNYYLNTSETKLYIKDLKELMKQLRLLGLTELSFKTV